MLRSDPSLKVVLLIPHKKKEFFETNFGDERITIEAVERTVGKVDAFLNDFALASFLTKSAGFRKKSGVGWLFPYTKHLFIFAPVFFRAYHYFYNFFMPRGRYAKIFEKHTPSMLFATDIFAPLDANFMLEARRRKIPVLGMIRSWDNLTTKGPFPVRPDQLLVANDIMATEAKEIHHYGEQHITRVGIPHYDRYKNEAILSRRDFCDRLGIDEKKKIVLYSPLGDRFFRNNTFDRDVIEVLSKSLPDNAVLLVRLPPTDAVNLKDIKLPKHNVFFDRPGVQLHSDNTFFKQNELSLKDEAHLIDTLYYSDVLVSISTTLFIDIAMFGKSLIAIGYNSRDRKVCYPSAAHMLEYDHIIPLLQTKGVQVANTPEELAMYVNDYLRHPEKDKKERNEIIRTQVWMSDGKASQRLFNAVVSFLNK